MLVASCQFYVFPLLSRLSTPASMLGTGCGVAMSAFMFMVGVGSAEVGVGIGFMHFFDALPSMRVA